MRFVKTIKRYAKVTQIDEIARRYFVMNAFDGALTMLGVLVGAYLTGSPDVRIIISAGVGASIAMGISGFTGAYMTESAERLKKLKELEETMLVKLEDTIHGRASKFASILTALVDGISPALAAMIILSPFILIRYGILTTHQAFQGSIILTGLELFFLGAYLGKISSESLWRNGTKMILVGLFTAGVVFITSLALGSPV